MAIEDDVLVIGGGLAGVAAALAAARTGARVRVVSHKQSTLRQASGLVDVLGYAERAVGATESAPFADPFNGLDALPADHPYAVVGEDAIRAGLDLFDDAVPDYRGGHTDRNALVFTHGGAVKPTARYPASVAPGLASDDRDALLVGFESDADFDAPLAAAHLDAAGVPFDVRGATVAFPGDLRVDAKLTRYARALDRDETIDYEGRAVGTREALAEAVKPHLDGAERVGFPALLGEDAAADVRADLESALGAAVFEVPTGPPSLLGLRLDARLSEALDAAGVRVTSGVKVVDFDGAAGESGGGAGGDDGDATSGDDDAGRPSRIERVYADREGQRVPFAADQYVLATGGLVGKGIESDREAVREPVFDCHVPHPTERYDWFEDGPFDDHAFARFGVRIDGECRPLDAEDEVEFDNLRAAGSILGGHDFAREKSGGGVSLATGYAAGTAAGGAVGASAEAGGAGAEAGGAGGAGAEAGGAGAEAGGPGGDATRGDHS